VLAGTFIFASFVSILFVSHLLNETMDGIAFKVRKKKRIIIAVHSGSEKPVWRVRA